MFSSCVRWTPENRLPSLHPLHPHAYRILPEKHGNFENEENGNGHAVGHCPGLNGLANYAKAEIGFDFRGLAGERPAVTGPRERRGRGTCQEKGEKSFRLSTFSQFAKMSCDPDTGLRDRGSREVIRGIAVGSYCT